MVDIDKLSKLSKSAIKKELLKVTLEELYDLIADLLTRRIVISHAEFNRIFRFKEDDVKLKKEDVVNGEKKQRGRPRKYKEGEEPYLVGQRRKQQEKLAEETEVNSSELFGELK